MKKNNKIKQKASVKKNYIYNLIFQAFALITIFVTTPYITRILGAEKIGIYSYTYSIVTYFILIGSLGIALYGQREIAYYQDDKEKLSKTFFEIFILRFILLIVTGVLFYILFCLKGEYSVYYKLLMFELIGSGIDIIWLYQGLEDFKKVVIRNILIRLSCVILIFIFVKNNTDLWKYFLLTSLSTFLGNFSLWLELPKYIEKVKLKTLNIKKHIKPILILFIPQIAIQIYTVLDKTMIGYITNNMSYVGIYQKTQEIVKMGMTIVTSYGTVVFPRFANNFIKKQNKEMAKDIKNAFSCIWLIGLPLTLGLMACSNNFVGWYLGTEFEQAKSLLMLFSVIILIIGLNTVIGMQYLIATKKQKVYTIAVITGAIVNVIGNFILIKYYNNYGAVIASIIAELVILLIEFYYIKEQLKGNINYKMALKCLMSSIVMFIIIYTLGKYMEPTLITTSIQMILGIIIYLIILIILKEEMIIKTLDLIKRKERIKI